MTEPWRRAFYKWSNDEGTNPDLVAFAAGWNAHEALSHAEFDAHLVPILEAVQQVEANELPEGAKLADPI